MWIVRDLLGGPKPPPIDVYYNNQDDADGTEQRYAGGLCKITDHDDIDNGMFFTWAGESTAMENVCGILAEDPGITGNYKPSDASYGMTLRKMYPIFPSTVIRAEYSQADAAGDENYDTGATIDAGGDDLLITITTADTLIGGWIYFLNGDNGGYLHYVYDSETTYAELATVTAGAVVGADDFLVIESHTCHEVDFDATYSGIKSEVDDNVKADQIMGFMHYIEAPTVPFQPLDRDKHDGLYVPNARFYHDFVIPSRFDSSGYLTHPNPWTCGIFIG